MLKAKLITARDGSKHIRQVERTGSFYHAGAGETTEQVLVRPMTEDDLNKIHQDLGINNAVEKVKKLVYNNLPELVDNVAYASDKIDGKFHYRLIFEHIK